MRKLARELKRSPAEVLGLLHHLGFTRYSSPEDMVADGPATKARTAARKGVRPPSVAPRAVRSTPPPAQTAPASSPPSDLMAQLVPGVLKQGVRSPARPPSPPPAAASDTAATLPGATEPSPAPGVQASPTVPGPSAQEHRQLQERLDATAAELESTRRELQSAREALDALQSAPAEGVGVLELLEARGLRGTEEAEAAVASLAGRRLLTSVLLHLRLPSPAASDLERVLAQRLMLLDGPPPAGLELASVTVSPDRAEAPGGQVLEPLLERLGEEIMLCGCRRLRIAGVPTRWHPVFRASVDPRVQLSFAPGGARDASGAQADLDAGDLVLLVGVTASEDADAVYAEARQPVVRADDLLGGLRAALDALQP